MEVDTTAVKTVYTEKINLKVLVPTVDRFKSLAYEQHDSVPAEKSVRASNRPFVDPHSGILHCSCGHDMGQLQWPLAAGIHHLNGRCRWSCCNTSWESKSCSHEFGNVVNEPSKYKPWEKRRTYETSLEQLKLSYKAQEAELLGTLRKSSAADKANELLSNRSLANQKPAEIKEKEVGDEENASGDGDETSDGDSAAFYVDPTPSMVDLGEVVVDGAAAATDGALYGAGIVASLLHSNFVKPFMADPVVIPSELEDILKELIECETQDEHKKLLDAAVKMYLEILELSEAQYLTLESWIEASSSAWKLFHNVASAPQVMDAQEEQIKALITASNMPQTSDEVLAELQKCTFPNNRTGLPVLKASTFIDWYVMHHFRQVKFTIPEVTGFPLLLEIHLSAAALSLKKKPALYSLHKDLITQSNFTFDRAIQCGIDFPSLAVGCIAGDEESYALFSEFYKSVIVESGAVSPRGDVLEAVWGRGHRGCKDWNIDSIVNTHRIDNLYVRECSVKARRNLAGISFPTHCSRAGRRKVERVVHAALNDIEGEFVGSYQPLFSLTTNPAVADASSNYINPNKFCAQIGAGRDWPFGRGVYKSDDLSLCIFVNGEDHLQFEVVGRSIAGHTDGCDIVNIFKKFSRAIATVEHCLFQDSETSFAISNEFGFLTSCPSKCGTALDVEYAIKLDQLNCPVYGLHEICARLGLKCAPVQEGIDSTVWRFSAVHHLGCSEVEMMQTLVDGVVALIAMEKCLEKNDSDGFSYLVNLLPKVYVMATVQGGQRGDEDDTNNDNNNGSGPASFSKVAVNPEDDYPLFSAQHSSLMSKHLTRELYTTLRSPEATTAACGWSVSQLIRVGCEIPNHSTGVMMGGVESYETYKHLIAPILADYHGFNPIGYDRSSHLTDLDLIQALDQVEAIASIYLRKVSFSASRNLSAFPFAPSMSRKQRRMVEFLLSSAFKSLDGDLVGNYVPLQAMTKAQQRILSKRKVMFASPADGGPLVAGGCARDLPDARGVFMSKTGRIIGIVNGEDHVKLVVEGASKDVGETVKLFAKAIDRLEAALQPNGFCFAHSNRLGYLTSKLEDVGTALRIRFSVVLPALSRDSEQLIELASEQDMTATRDDDNDESWTFTNIQVLCITEADTLRRMLTSLLYISRLEQSMRKMRFSATITETVDKQRRKSLSAAAIGQALKDREDSIHAAKVKAKENLENFASNHRRRSESRRSYISVLSSLQQKADEEERQKADNRKRLSDMVGSRSSAARVRRSFHSVMVDIVANVPLSQEDKTFFEAEGPASTPIRSQGFATLSSFVSLANEGFGSPLPEAPALGLYGSLSTPRSTPPSPASPRRSGPSPNLSPPKPQKPPTPDIITAEMQSNQIVENYKAAIFAADNGRTGIFGTVRTIELPLHLARKITTEVVAMVKTSGPKSKVPANKYYVYVDPISYTLHWKPQGPKSVEHRCLTLVDCTEIVVSTKASMFVNKSELTFSFKFSDGGTVDVELPADQIMSKLDKIAWLRDLQQLLYSKSKTITISPSAQKYILR